MPPRRWSSPGSADVSKLMYHMRINRNLLDHDLLAAFDVQMRASVSASLSGDLPDHSWWQATTGVTCAGPGLRTAVGVTLPAFVASRITCRPWCPPRLTTSASLLASRVSPTWPSMTRAPTQPLRVFSRRTRRTRPQLLLGQLDEALAERELLWRNVLSGTEDAMQDLPSPSLRNAHPPGTKALEDPGPHRHLCGHGSASRAASGARAPKLLRLPRTTTGTWRRRGRPHVDLAPEPASRHCRGVR